MWMIILGLGVVYIANDDDENSCSMTRTYMNPIWICGKSMLGVFYSNFEYIIVSYDVMWVCVVYNP